MHTSVQAFLHSNLINENIEITLIKLFFEYSIALASKNEIITNNKSLSCLEVTFLYHVSNFLIFKSKTFSKNNFS